MDYNILIAGVFGILPSLIWLTYYLTKDLHPEPKRMILNIFLWGALIALPIFFVEIGLKYLLDSMGVGISPLVYSLIYWFIIIAFSEELFKYLVVRVKVVDSPHLDEPVDIMIYMVVAALGFAAIENVLYLFVPTAQMSFNDFVTRTLIIDSIRFIGATFLHTLCSAVIGYAIAISLCDQKNKLLELASGIVIATGLHGLFNFSIITLEGNLKIIVPVLVILTLSVLVFFGFEKLKKMKGICKIN